MVIMVFDAQPAAGAANALARPEMSRAWIMTSRMRDLRSL
jgi:hypothetical protein